MDSIRYPLGTYVEPEVYTPELREQSIGELDSVPAALRAAVAGLSDEQLDTPYREGGWTIRQVVHHLADTHLNAYVRFRLALTEIAPRVVIYDENLWAELYDARRADVAPSLALVEGLHRRWALLLRHTPASEFARVYIHPDHGAVTLDWLVAHYAWHGHHHVAQITSWRERVGATEARLRRDDAGQRR